MAQATKTKTKVSKRSNVGIQAAVSEPLVVGEQEVAVDSLTATSSLEAPQEKIPGPLKDLPEGLLETNPPLIDDLLWCGDPPKFGLGQAPLFKLPDTGGAFSIPSPDHKSFVHGTAEPYNTHWWQGPHIENVPHNPTPKIRTQYEYYKDRDCSFQTLNSFGEQGWQLTTTFTLPDVAEGKSVVYYIFMREKQSA